MVELITLRKRDARGKQKERNKENFEGYMVLNPV